MLCNKISFILQIEGERELYTHTHTPTHPGLRARKLGVRMRLEGVAYQGIQAADYKPEALAEQEARLGGHLRYKQNPPKPIKILEVAVCEWGVLFAPPEPLFLLLHHALCEGEFVN